MARPSAPSNWQSLVDAGETGRTVCAAVEKELATRAEGEQALDEALSDAPEGTIQSWLYQALESDRVREVMHEHGVHRVWHDTHSRSCGSVVGDAMIKPDLVLTTERCGLTTPGVVMLVELKSGTGSLTPAHRGQALYTAEAALRAASGLRTHLFVFLTNLRQGTLFRCSLDPRGCVAVEAYAETANVPETMLRFAHAMCSSDVTLDVPYQTVGGFVVVGALGKGAFSTVLKITGGGGAKPRFAKIHENKAAFSREVDMLSRLDEVIHISMEECCTFSRSGTELYAIIGSPVLEKVKFCNVQGNDWVVLLGALQRVHERGVVHRDVRPDNFCLRDAAGQLTLVDFGLAVETGTEELFGGTIKYAADTVLQSLAGGEISLTLTNIHDLESFVKCFLARLRLQEFEMLMNPRPAASSSLETQAAWFAAAWRRHMDTFLAVELVVYNGMLEAARSGDYAKLRRLFSPSNKN